jgi:hypothetical protein
MLLLTVLVLMNSAGTALAQGAPCTTEQRRDALRSMQAEVFALAPHRLDSLAKAIEPGRPLAGFILSHGHVVLAHGAVPVGNVRATDPWPHLLLYAPSPSSTPSDWRDFDGPDGPYQLTGWAYTVRYEPGSRPPHRRCIADDEWYVHDAGWHLTNGGMLVTPDATVEPPRPKLDVGFVVWHPQYWDLHVWPGEDGVPTVSFVNPRARPGGLSLPEEAFFRLVNGRRQPISQPK